MAIKWEDFIFEAIFGVVSCQRRLRNKQVAEILAEDFELEEQEGKPSRLKPRAVEIDVGSHVIEGTEDDLIESGEILLIDEFDLDIETDLDLEEVPEEEREYESQVFRIVTHATKRLFGHNTHIKISAKVKAHSPAKGLTILRDYNAKKLRTELKGIKRHERK